MIYSSPQGISRKVFQLPPQLSDTEVGEALTLGQRLKQWLSDLEEYALNACLDGREIDENAEILLRDLCAGNIIHFGNNILGMDEWALIGAWAASFIDMFVRLVMMGHRFNGGKWREIKV